MALSPEQFEVLKEKLRTEKAEGLDVEEPVPEEPEGRGGIAGFGVGALKGVGSTLFGGLQLGERLKEATIGKVAEAITRREGERVIPEEKPEFLVPRGRAEKVGFTTEQIAEFAIPGTKIIKGAKAAEALTKGVAGAGRLGRLLGLGARATTEAAGFGTIGSLQKGELDKGTTILAGSIPVVLRAGAPIASGVSKTVGSFFFGPEGVQGIIARYKDPIGIQPFIRAARRQTGGQATDDIVTLLNKTMKRYGDRVIGQFRAAEGKLKDVIVQRKEVVEPVLASIKSFLKINKLTPRQVSQSGLNDTEIRIVNRVVREINRITSAKAKPTTRAVLNLKRTIAELFRGSENTSKADAIITRVNRALNGVIESKDPVFRQASRFFSTEKQLLDKIGVNVVGRNAKVNVETTANKVFQLAKDLDNAFKREASERLLNQLGGRTGVDFTRILRALKTAVNIDPQQARGLRAGVIRELVRALEVTASETARVAGLTRIFGRRAIRKIPQAVRKTTPIRGALFEENQ